MLPSRLLALSLVILPNFFIDQPCLAFVSQSRSAFRSGGRGAPFRSKLMQSSHTAETRVAVVDQGCSSNAVAPPIVSKLPAAPDDDSVGLDYAAEQQQDYSRGLLSSHSLQSSIVPVLSAAMLLTGNTVGAGSLVLPEFVAGPGLAASTGLFVVCYLVNLISGLVIAEVAIKQRELSGTDIPSSSFKQFAEANLENNPIAVHTISAVSLFVNGCIHAFDVSRAGLVGSALLNGAVSPTVVSFVWAGLLVSMVATQSSHRLSQVASLCVAAVFLSFGTVLLPGLASVSDPVAVMLQPGTAVALEGASSWLDSVSQATPVILVALMYQNIVPTITKYLNYNRTRTVLALALGSLIPLVMYVALSFACVGGGLDVSPEGLGSGGLESVAMAIFSLSTLVGSSLGSSLSISEEIDSFHAPMPMPEPQNAAQPSGGGGGFRVSSVVLATLIPLAAALAFSGEDGLTGALGIAGSLGAPLLYGAIPAWLAWNQRQAHQRAFVVPIDDDATISTALISPPADLVPPISLPLLGVLSMGFAGDGLVQWCGEFLAFAT